MDDVVFVFFEDLVFEINVKIDGEVGNFVFVLEVDNEVFDVKKVEVVGLMDWNNVFVVGWVSVEVDVFVVEFGVLGFVFVENLLL